MPNKLMINAILCPEATIFNKFVNAVTNLRQMNYMQTVPKKNQQYIQKIVFLKTFSGYIEYYLLISVETKVKASEKNFI